MSFSIRNFFSQLYLSVAIEGSECSFYGRVFRAQKLIKTIDTKISDSDEKVLNQKILNYVRALEKAYSEVYISLFFNFVTHGALPTVIRDDFAKFNIQAKDIVTLKMQDSWSIYADKEAVNAAKDILGKDEIDLIYSPIAVLFYELSKRVISAKTTLYAYSRQNSFTLCIFKDKKMKLATFVKIDEAEQNDEASQNFKEEDITDIDNVIEKEGDAQLQDDFQSLDDLINADSGGAQDFEDLNYDINMPASVDVGRSVEIFGRDMNMFSYIKAAIAEFYANPLYEGDFIEQIIVLDEDKTSATFLQYLQSELLVEASAHPIKTLEVMNELMMKEIVNG